MGLRDVHGCSRLTEMDNAWLVTVRKIEDRKNKSSGEGERKRKERDSALIMHRARTFLRTTYHYRIFGIQIPGSKNAL